jgi:hypothetical protein
MSQIGPEEPEPKGSVHVASDAANQAPTTHDDGVATGQPDPPDHNPSIADEELPTRFRETLESAEHLLLYSAETGVDIEDATRNSILEARAAGDGKWNEKMAANLLVALAKLAARLKPVTAESLRACSIDSRATIRTYWIVAICLAVLIVPMSVATFATSAISGAISKDVTTANELAVKLTAQLEPPSAQTPTAAAGGGPGSTLPPLAPGLSRVDVITELQTFAATMRAIDTRARQLNWFIFRAEKDPFEAERPDPAKTKKTFQLPIPLPPDLAGVTNDRIAVYQDVRSFAQSVVDDVSVFFGAITTCILPVLYALLGTCAYLLRSFEQDMSNRTFIPSHADSPRFLVAGIGGAVVGLFNNFAITQAASIPPLAIAFLVGYAVDVFFSFLEGLIQAFTRNKSSATTQSGTPPAGAKA